MSCVPAKKPPPKKGGKKKGGGKKKRAPAKATDDDSQDKKPKGRPKAEIKWTEEDLKKAIALVKSGESAWKVSRKYGIKYDVLASATKISYYGLMYSKCKGEKNKTSPGKEVKKEEEKEPVTEEKVEEDKKVEEEKEEENIMKEEGVKEDESQT